MFTNLSSCMLVQPSPRGVCVSYRRARSIFDVIGFKLHVKSLECSPEYGYTNITPGYEVNLWPLQQSAGRITSCKATPRFKGKSLSQEGILKTFGDLVSPSAPKTV